jgi:hypothetical protein
MERSRRLLLCSAPNQAPWGHELCMTVVAGLAFVLSPFGCSLTDPPITSTTQPSRVDSSVITATDHIPSFIGHVDEAGQLERVWHDFQVAGFTNVDARRVSFEPNQFESIGDWRYWLGSVLDWRVAGDLGWPRVAFRCCSRELGDVWPVGGSVGRLVSVERTRESAFADRRLTIEHVAELPLTPPQQSNFIGFGLEPGHYAHLLGLGEVFLGRVHVDQGELVGELFLADIGWSRERQYSLSSSVVARTGDVLRRRWSDGVQAEYHIREITAASPLHQIKGWMVLDCIGLSAPAPSAMRESLVNRQARPVRQFIELDAMNEPFNRPTGPAGRGPEWPDEHSD